MVFSMKLRPMFGFLKTATVLTLMYQTCQGDVSTASNPSSTSTQYPAKDIGSIPNSRTIPPNMEPITDNTKAYIKEKMAQCDTLRMKLNDICNQDWNSCKNKCHKQMLDIEGPQTCSCDDKCYLYQDCCHDKENHCPGPDPLPSLTETNSVCLKNGYRVISGCKNTSYPLNTEKLSDFDNHVVSDTSNLLHYLNEDVFRCNQPDSEAISVNTTFWTKELEVPSGTTVRSLHLILGFSNMVLDEPPPELTPRFCYPSLKFSFCPNNVLCGMIKVQNMSAMCEVASLPFGTKSLGNNRIQNRQAPRIFDTRTSTMTMPATTDVKITNDPRPNHDESDDHLEESADQKGDDEKNDSNNQGIITVDTQTGPSLLNDMDPTIDIRGPGTECSEEFFPNIFGQEQDEGLKKVVLHGNRDDDYFGRITAAKQESQRWQEILCRSASRITKRSKNPYECFVSKCKQGYFFHSEMCLVPVKMTVQTKFRNSVQSLKAEELDNIIQKSIASYPNMTTGQIENRLISNKSSDLYLAKSYHVEEVRDNDQNKALPISLHLSSAITTYLQDPEYPDSVNLCFLLHVSRTVSTPIPDEHSRCDKINASGVYSNMYNYMLVTPDPRSSTNSSEDGNSISNRLFSPANQDLDNNNAITVGVTSLLEMLSVFMILYFIR